jgi:hypothetical protein
LKATRLPAKEPVEVPPLICVGAMVSATRLLAAPLDGGRKGNAGQGGRGACEGACGEIARQPRAVVKDHVVRGCTARQCDRHLRRLSSPARGSKGRCESHGSREGAGRRSGNSDWCRRRCCRERNQDGCCQRRRSHCHASNTTRCAHGSPPLRRLLNRQSPRRHASGLDVRRRFQNVAWRSLSIPNDQQEQASMNSTQTTR